MYLRRLLTVIFVLTVFGCADQESLTEASAIDASITDTNPDMDVIECESGISFWFEDSDSDELILYPDDRYTQPDESSPTGIRLKFDSERFPWFANLPNLIAPTRSDMEALSGFAHNGGVLIRYHGSVLPELPSEEMSTTAEGVIWVDLDATPVKRIAFRATHTLDETGFILDPLATLTPGHRHAVLVTPALWPEETCIERNSDFQNRLTMPADNTFGDNRFVLGILDAMESLSLDSNAIIGATSFTTHMVDEVKYRLPLWPLGAPALPLVKRELKRIFVHRMRALNEAFV